jgi:uncharacterized OB-fold protein
MGKTTARISLEPSVLQVSGEEEGDVLLGSLCQRCNRVFFPSREWCAACCEPVPQVIELSRDGVLEGFTLVHRKQAYGVLDPPYVLGEVDLPEGVRVYTTINVTSDVSEDEVRPRSTVGPDNLDSLRTGQKVVLDPVVIKRDQDGQDVVAYNFSVVEG